eukprot:362872-Chlamydomonas_euryale.AAC.3
MSQAGQSTGDSTLTPQWVTLPECDVQTEMHLDICYPRADSSMVGYELSSCLPEFTPRQGSVVVAACAAEAVGLAHDSPLIPVVR